MYRLIVFTAAFLLFAALPICAGFAAEAAPAQGESVALTVYNDGNAVVKEVRAIDVPQGTGEIRFEEVAATIDPTSVTFRSLTDPDGTTILEQNYEYDLVSADKLLEKYLGKNVQVVAKDGTAFTGPLMSFDEAQIVVGGAGGELSIVQRADNVRSVSCGSLPEGLIVRPTLMWLLSSPAGGKQMVQMAYSASQCSWRADYALILDDKDAAFDLDGWVTLTNNSGKTYKDASLKLIAGEVHRVEAERGVDLRGGGGYGMLYAGEPQFTQKAFGEYHMYTLPRPTTIKDRQVKQIELLNASGVPVLEKKYLFDPMQYVPDVSQPITRDYSVAEKGKVQVYIIFRNDDKSRLGMPLPAGRVRMFKRDGKDLVFVGEDEIEHTPKDERVELQMGVAFDVTAERRRVSFVKGRGANWMEESFEITLRNHKKEPVTVNAREHLFRWTKWSITQKSQDYTKLDAQTIEFPVTLQPDEEKKVSYTVRYEW